MEPLSIREAIQGMVPSDGDISEARVTGESPVSVVSLSDEKLVLSGSVLIIPEHLTDHEVKADISGGTISADITGDHSHTIASLSIQGATMSVKNGLKMGEKVSVLNLGSQYVILGRS